MPQLPEFVRALRRTARALRPRAGAVPLGIQHLYAEWEERSWDPDWLASPRGKWVDFQLRWYEQRLNRGEQP